MLPTIEPALLRPGSIHLVVELSLPSDDARLQIFDIYVKNLLQNSLIESDADIETIIHATTGLTGAYIERILHFRVINAIRCDVLPHGWLNISEHEAQKLWVSNLDFKDALTKGFFPDCTEF